VRWLCSPMCSPCAVWLAVQQTVVSACAASLVTETCYWCMQCKAMLHLTAKPNAHVCSTAVYCLQHAALRKL
jgi:hypothetical protein